MKPYQCQLVVIFWMLLLFHASATVRYVMLYNTNSMSPYTDWSTAATNIQDAIDVAADGDLILVTNGPPKFLTNGLALYQIGGGVVYGSQANRVVINKAITVQSFNGPAGTWIIGNPWPWYSAIRCVYLTNGAALVGFTLNKGTTRDSGDTFKEQSGGAVWCESTNAFISNCVIFSNSAEQFGGGVYSGTLSNCLLFNNYVFGFGSTGGGGACSSTLLNSTVSSNFVEYGVSSGGGVDLCVLSNCTLVGNSASQGAGASSSVLNNCTISSNSASAVGGGAYVCALSNCTLVGNSVYHSGLGGGAFGGTLNNCMLADNSAGQGGAVYGSYGGYNGLYPAVLNNCNISNNLANDGGGTYGNCNLNGCALVGNIAYWDGGGAYNGTLNNCTLTGNSAGEFGGGVAGAILGICVLNNCVLFTNQASSAGAGAWIAILNNCSLVGNSAPGSFGGSAAGRSVLKNCIVYYNSGTLSNYDSSDLLTNCCTQPLPTSGVGNITNEPLFINLDGCDFHLQSNSPCINAGNNTCITNSTDFDGNPRIKGGTVDIGAYEYQTPTSIISYAWLLQYGLPTDGSADYLDSDGDGLNNWQEWRTGTNPNNPLSVLKMASADPTSDPPGTIVSWQSVSGITYFLQSSTNLAAQPAFSTIQSNIVGQAGTTSYTDTTATNGGLYFYRVGVQ